MEPRRTDVVVKILIIGEMGVGKTSLLRRYIEKEFTTTYISTIGVDFKVKSIDIDDARVKLQIWDTAGQERFHSITTTYYRGTDGVVVVYDVTDATSFDNVERWFKETDEFDDTVPRVLVGNKADDISLKTVTSEEAREFAIRKSCQFFETSAKLNTNVDEMFEAIAGVALETKMKRVNGNLSKSSKPQVIRVVGAAGTRHKSKCCYGSDAR